MTESESVALPFGDSPSLTNKEDYTGCFRKMQAFFTKKFIFLKCPFTTWQAVHFIYTHKMPSCLSGKSPKPSESIRNLLEPLYPMGYFNPIAIHFLYRFIFLLNFSESLSFFLSIYPFFHLVPSYMSLAWKDVCF